MLRRLSCGAYRGRATCRRSTINRCRSTAISTSFASGPDRDQPGRVPAGQQRFREGRTSGQAPPHAARRWRTAACTPPRCPHGDNRHRARRRGTSRSATHRRPRRHDPCRIGNQINLDHPAAGGRHPATRAVNGVLDSAAGDPFAGYLACRADRMHEVRNIPDRGQVSEQAAAYLPQHRPEAPHRINRRYIHGHALQYGDPMRPMRLTHTSPRERAPTQRPELVKIPTPARRQPEQGKHGVRSPLPGRPQVNSFTPHLLVETVRRHDVRFVPLEAAGPAAAVQAHLAAASMCQPT